MSKKDMESVVILGAGTASAVAAGLLAEAGRSVTLIDEQKNVNFKIGETLPAEAAMILAKAGIRQICDFVPTLPSAGNRSCWGSGIVQTRSSMMNPYGCGWYLDRVAFDAALINRARNAGVLFKPGSRLLRTVSEAGRWTLQFQSTEAVFSIDCRWVLDATGRRAAFARAQGAKRLVLDKLVAIIGVLSSRGRIDADLTTLIESAPNGWWYSAQIPGRRRVVVYFTDGDMVKDCGATKESAWFHLASQTQLIREFAYDPQYALNAPLRVVLADTSRLDSAAAEGWLAIGDSAMAMDPLSSVGITDAIKSAVDAARMILESSASENGRVSEYASRMADVHARNNRLRLQYYRMEQRWPESAFWNRRHAYPANSMEQDYLASPVHARGSVNFEVGMARRNGS
jgi:flavin-dependent dehydrogenase